jgi:hypothetical protein
MVYLQNQYLKNKKIMPKFTKSTSYKMKGFSGFGNSPLKQKEKRHYLEKEQTGPITGEKKQLPLQPGEDPDVAVTGGSQHEVVNDLEDRIEFVQSDVDEKPTPEKKAALAKLKERLKRERAKL